MRNKRTRIDYPEVMRTLGYIIQRDHLSEVTITEFDGGWIIAGLTFKTTMQGFIRVPVDMVLSHDDIRSLTDQLAHQRQPQPQLKRGWLR